MPFISSKISASKNSATGMVADTLIVKGECIWRWRALRNNDATLSDKSSVNDRSSEEQKQLAEEAEVMQNHAESRMVQVQAAADVTVDPSKVFDHSCDPNMWFCFDKLIQDNADVSLCAMRDIQVGEELCFDYATSMTNSLNFKCTCGAKTCRGKITSEDWQLPDVQERYSGHVMTHVARLIAKHRRRWGFVIKNDDKIGRYVVNTIDIPKGALVMVLPPNRICTPEEIVEWNHCIQVQSKPPLYSDAFDNDDLDVCIAHSCDPTTQIVVERDYTANLWARRDIPAGSVISFDYEATEEDMTSQGVDFVCECGAASCRGSVVGNQLRQSDAVA